MKSGSPAAGDLYTTPRGRTVEILAVKPVEFTGVVESYAPVGSTEVIAFKFVGGHVVHLTTRDDVQEWVRVQEAY